MNPNNKRGWMRAAACHPSQRQGYSSHALFTDFTFDNIGVPRNWAIPANTPGSVSPVGGARLTMVEAPVDVPADAEYAYYDVGLCGLFKVPTLRNIAITAPYFHNGVFSTLRQVIEWYVTRDINNNTGNNPNPVAAGPVAYDANVNIGEVPYTPPTFGGGQAPTLTSDEIGDIIAFLCTLTDGFDPQNPTAYNLPAQFLDAATSAAANTRGSAP
jgi:cytochrome c peroxidase